LFNLPLLPGLQAWFIDWMREDPKPEEPTPRTHFHEYEINGLLWQWDYNGDAPDINSIWCRCARDQTIIAYAHFAGEVVLKCDTCQTVIRERGNPDDLKRRIARQIDCVIVSGEWKSHIRIT
jgi:hypothetical protein